MHDFTQEQVDIAALRTRLERTDGAALLSFGEAAAFRCHPEQCVHGKPRETFMIQLREAREEWRRRHR